jgi:hypothetical protein
MVNRLPKSMAFNSAKFRDIVFTPLYYGRQAPAHSTKENASLA